MKIYTMKNVSFSFSRDLLKVGGKTKLIGCGSEVLQL